MTNVCSFLFVFYEVARALLCAEACWVSRRRVEDVNRLNSQTVVSKLRLILDSDSHQLRVALVRHSSTFSRRLCSTKLDHREPRERISAQSHLTL